MLHTNSIRNLIPLSPSQFRQLIWQKTNSTTPQPNQPLQTHINFFPLFLLSVKMHKKITTGSMDEGVNGKEDSSS